MGYKILVINPIDVNLNSAEGTLSAESGDIGSSDIDVGRLSEELKNLVSIAEALEPAGDRSLFQVSELNFDLVITTEGKLGILGSGLKTGVKAGISVKIVRSDS